MTMAPVLHIKLLGDFRLVYGDTAVATVNTARLQSLLVYLLIHRDAPQPRQQLAFLLWPDSTEAQARTNLRREFHNLRHALPDANCFLHADSKMLQWCPDALFTLDVAAFEEAAAAAERAETGGDSEIAREHLEAAVAIYRGDLLPSCYDEWLLAERERLRQLHIRALEQLAALLETQRDYRAAMRYAQRLLHYDSLQEATYRRLMRLHALNNDRAAALRVYHTCATVVQQELGVDPSRSTREVYERLLQADATEPLATHPSAIAATSPLIGRQHEWQQLQTSWRDAAEGCSQLVVVAGEAGIGKTRLAEELLRWAEQQGFATARSRSYAAEGRLAYAPVAGWLRSEALRTACARQAPVWLSEIARLLPELLVEHPELLRPEPLTQRWQRRRLFEALARVFLAVPRPLLLLLDDLQWCDQETLEWLRYLLRFDPQARLLVVGTARTEELELAHPLQTLLADVQHANQVREMTLAPLDAAETAALAAQVAGRELDADRAAALYQETEGNPLFVIEIVRAGLISEVAAQQSVGANLGVAPAPRQPHTSLPPKVQTVIASRLAQLSPQARELAALAATIGRAFTLDVLAAAHAGNDSVLVRAIDELWQRRIVREQGDNAYDFSHDKIREVAYAVVGTAHRRLLHRRVAEALEVVHAHDLDSVSGQVATHYERAGLAESAIEYYQRAARWAQGIYANEAAIQFLNRGLALQVTFPASSARDEQELAMQTVLGVSLVALKGYSATEVMAACSRAQELSRQLDRPLSSQLRRVLALACVVRGTFSQANTFGEQLLHQARQDRDLVLTVESHYVLGVSSFWQGAFSTARAHLEQALAHYHPGSRDTHLTMYGQDPRPVCLVRLAYVLWYLGYPEQAAQRGSEALLLAQQAGHPFSLGYVLTFGAWLANDARDAPAARTRVAAAMRLADEQGFAQWALMGNILHGWLRADAGEVEAGIAQIRRGMQAYAATGAQLGWPYYLALLAQAQAKAGKLAEALTTVDEALATAERGEERWYTAELHRLKGDFLRQSGAKASAVESCFRQALRSARQQDAKSLELRAATSLCRHWREQEREEDARKVLAKVYSEFAEGFDTTDLKEAAGLLSQEIR